jgi:Mg-chelatase subunit ChlD
LSPVSKLVLAIGISAMGSPLVAAPTALAQMGAFQVEIRRPESEITVPNDQTSIEVQGHASNLFAIKDLDLFLVMDTSGSLRKTDPNDHRSSGAIGLVRFLFWSNIHFGVVDFDREAKLTTPLTGDRTVVMQAIKSLDQHGKTNHPDGIRAALKGFEESGRPGSSRMILIFTDGMKKQKGMRKAVADARKQGVAISTVLLGSGAESTETMQEIAEATGGRFVAVADPSHLPDAFLNLRSMGVDEVTLRVNDFEPVSAELAGAVFSAQVPLVVGENRIVAVATSSDGREQEDVITVTVRPPGCAELFVRAERDGEPALSISNRAVEIVVDASGSMWGHMDGRTKIEIAKEILDDTLDWLPPDLNLSLRAYGHQSDPKEKNCEDTQLLVSPTSGDRAQIRTAIADLQPRGQTPLGFALGQVSSDLGNFDGERAVVLVTDGIESCGGDAPAAVRSLQDIGSVPVHVIGFGLDGKNDQELASLRAIADASGGKFLTAGSADELRQALNATVGTSYRVWRDAVPVARGSLGADERIPLPAGDYRVQLNSSPPHALPIALSSEESFTVVLRREGEQVVHRSSRQAVKYMACQDPGTDALLGQVEGVPSEAGEASSKAPPAAPMPAPVQADSPAMPDPGDQPSH